MNKNYIIIGGGILGSAIAREIALRDLGSVTVLEKESKLGLHATGRNSQVIHSGINQTPRTNKANFCLRGSEALRKFCTSNKIKINVCGTLVTAINSQEVKILEKLQFMANQVGVPDVNIINQSDLKELEPNAAGTMALSSPTGAVVDSLDLLNTIVKQAKSLNVKFNLNTKVNQINNNKIHTSNGVYSADHIINCAGLQADEIAHMMGIGLNYTIVPFRGEYMEVKNLDINSMIYQVPDLKYPFLSVHLTKLTNDRVIAGPTATLSLGRESYKKQFNLISTLNMASKINFWRMTLSSEFMKLAYRNFLTSVSKKAFLQQIQKLTTKSISISDLSDYRSGIRAQLVNRQGQMVKDIMVDFQKSSTHILNAVSPGLTCSLAFSEYVVDNLGQINLNNKRSNYNHG